MSDLSLAIKYRPKTFDDVTEQQYIKDILLNQIYTDSIKNAYLFCGGAGTGKTTTARIFANQINEGKGNPIEIDAASNNGVDQVRIIIDDAKFKPLESKYKVYILDEVHMLSIGAWNAMLKLLEEPPKTTIFLLCTTDPQKIPATILSRVQRYNFQRISFDGIVNRLKYIIDAENYEICDKRGNDFCPGEADEILIDYDNESLEYIAKIAEGGMRDAISLLDKCISYSNHLSIENVTNALGISDYNSLDHLLKNILDNNRLEILSTIDNVFRSGKDLKQFIKQFITFILNVSKYMIYNDFKYIQIPSTINLDKYKIYSYDDLMDLLDLALKLNTEIKYDTNPKVLIESRFLLYVILHEKPNN